MPHPIIDRRLWPAEAQFSAESMPDGWPLRRVDWPARGAARGSILFQVGRGDMPEKYIETFAHFVQAGWNVTSVDWRGQGGSGRFLADPTTGHVSDFSVWTEDLGEIWKRWRAARPGPHVLMGHSMGGHLVLRGLIEGSVDPDAMVLSAPMLGFETKPLPLSWVATLVGWLARLRPERKAWGSNERPAPPRADRQPFLTHDDARYADEMWWRDHCPELVMGPPSLQWLAAAYRSTQWTHDAKRLAAIDTPIQIVGSDDDKLVSPHAMRDFAQMLPNARLHMFGAGVAHEVLREVDAVRDEALDIIDAFLDETAPRP